MYVETPTWNMTGIALRIAYSTCKSVSGGLRTSGKITVEENTGIYLYDSRKGTISEINSVCQK